MALVLSPSSMTSSILLRPPPFLSPSPSPSPSPIPTSLPALQADTPSSSSSVSESYPDLKCRPASARSTRRIRFAPLPETERDLLDPQSPIYDLPQSDVKPATQLGSPSVDPCNGLPLLSPIISPASTGSSAPTVRAIPASPPKHTRRSSLKLLPIFPFLRRIDSNSSKSHVSQSAPPSRTTFFSSVSRSSNSAPNTPFFHSPKLSRTSTDEIFSFRTKSLFHNRSASVSTSGASPSRPSSPPPKRSDPSKHVRSASASAAPSPTTKPVNARRNRGESPGQSHELPAIGVSSPKSRRASTSALSPGAGGGRHASSAKMFSNNALPSRPSTAPSSPRAPSTKHVKMLNGRVYGAKRYAAQTLADPFANVREEPEFVEWGYGGMGSVHASAGIGNDMWKGLQRSERGGALLAASSDSHSASGNPSAGAGGGRGSGAHATSPMARRRMSADIPECGMGNVGTGSGGDEDDGSGMAWLKKRRAEREAKARLEQEAKEPQRKTQEKRQSGDSLDASMYASTASTNTSLTACTSAASTDLTTPTTSPLASRSPSITDLQMTSSEPRDLDASPSAEEQSSKSPLAGPIDGHAHHILAAVRLSPDISISSGEHERTSPSPVDTETTCSTNSCSDDEEPSQGLDEEGEQDDVERDVQDVKRKTALGAGVEKISRHVGVEAR